MARSLSGTVVAFDGDAGLGTVAGDDGEAYPFHCTELVDGTRTVDVGAAVVFTVVPGPLGRWEAGAVTRRSAPAVS